MNRVWTPERDAVLRSVYPAGGPKAVALALGVTPVAAVSRAVRLGIDTGRNRPWTDAERDEVRRLYATQTAAEIARALGRSASGVQNVVYQLGIGSKCQRITPAAVELVRAGVEAGLTDAAIARQHSSVFNIANGHRRVKYIRDEFLKAPPNAEAIAEAKRKAIRTQAERLGVTIGGGLRKYSYRKYARECGWPEHFPPRACQIMNLLCDRGPMTRRQLVAAIGMTWRKRDSNNLKCKQTSYLGVLMQAGFVARQCRYTTGRPHGHNRLPNVYLPTAKAISWREEHGR